MKKKSLLIFLIVMLLVLLSVSGTALQFILLGDGLFWLAFCLGIVSIIVSAICLILYLKLKNRH
jgi:hypothetical protein